MAQSPPPPRRWLRWTLATGLLPACIVAFYLIENHRGERAWAAEKAKLEAASVSLNFYDHLNDSQEVADKDNVAAASLYAQAYDSRLPKGHPQNLLGVRTIYSARDLGHPAAGTPPDFAAILKLIRTPSFSGPPIDEKQAAQAILDHLSAHDTLFADLRTAAARPQIRFPIPWEKGTLTEQWHGSLCQKIARLLTLRSSSLLALGRTDEAFQDWRLLIRQAEIARTPTLFSPLVEQAILADAVIPISHGLARGQWSDAHLTQIDAALARLDLGQACIQSLRGEQALFVTAMGRYIGNRSQASDDIAKSFAAMAPFVSPGTGDSAQFTTRLLASLVPTGWIRQNQASYTRDSEAIIAELRVAVSSGLFKPTPLTTRVRTPPGPDLGVYNSVSGLALRTAVLIIDSTRATAAQIALARTAIALEQHRRSTGALPATLTELTPPPPPDPITGAPLRYERLPDGKRFKLWSVALNGTDDGGIAKDYRVSSPDWVWCSWMDLPNSQ